VGGPSPLHGTIFRLEAHLERLRNSAKALAFNEIPSTEHIIEELRRTLTANEMRDDCTSA